MDIVLRNNIGGLGKIHENNQDLETFKSICNEYELSPPIEGCFPQEFIDVFLKSFQEEGHEYIFIGDEHGFERQAIYIQDMIDDKRSVKLNYPGHENWYTIKHEILYTTHWDSFFTLLCANKDIIERILSKHLFEGFYCNDLTSINWSLQQL